jgi:hypothetical protein
MGIVASVVSPTYRREHVVETHDLDVRRAAIPRRIAQHVEEVEAPDVYPLELI